MLITSSFTGRLGGLVASGFFMLTLGIGHAVAEPPDGHGWKKDDLPHPLGQQKRALRQQALEAKVHGKAHGKSHEVARGQYVELARESEDSIFTILGEFADLPHNSIAEPDRTVNNSTIWTEDFSREHYLDVLFAEGEGVNSVRNIYLEMSSNRYTVNGDVTEWVAVPGSAASYDDDISALHLWQFLEDSADGWYDAQLAAGKTPDEINDYLSQFDVWDRYDHDGDGNFDEPDGYIDHFQSVHAGEGEEAGGGVLGGAAIWSHRWYARFHLIGNTGSSYALYGGVQIGNSDYWIGDYTIEPENGGVGVFAHEFAHDLDLPDLYDTAGAENGTGFWTLMSSGSWTSDGTEDIGSKPVHMGAWEKFQLGWLNYEVAVAGSQSSHKIGPAHTNTRQAQALAVVLPDKEVLTEITEPYAGEYFYYSGAGNSLDQWMYKAFTLPAGSSLTAMVNVDIEYEWDYAYLVISTDGGASWQEVATSLSTNDDPNGQNFGHGITGSTFGAWIPLSADLSAYTGDVLIGLRYWTDPFVIQTGFMIDEISINGGPADGAEADEGWVLQGFSMTDGSEISHHFNAYLAEFRQYRGFDAGLETGPYNFGFQNNEALEDWVEHFPYQDGLLINYWDTSQTDNNVSTHPGSGLILPIDAHPEAMIRSDGDIWRNRIQTYDATFSLEDTDAVELNWNSVPSYHPSLPAESIFDDSNTYYDPANPTGSVKHPNTGTQIRIKSVSAKGGFMQLEVRPAPANQGRNKR